MANTLKFGNGEWYGKKDTILAFNDENNNFKPLPFNFTRNSSATRVNKEGLIEVVSNNEPRIDFKDSSEGALLLEPQRTNHFQQSNQFDTTWILSNVSVLGNQNGVGGSTDAWKLNANSGVGEKKIYVSGSSGIQTISVYAKKGTRDYLWLRGVTGGFNKRVFFNLSNGTIGNDEAISSKIIDINNGWYRCSAVFNQDGGYEFQIGVAENDNTVYYTDDGTGNIYIQNAQLEQGSYATSYIPTSGGVVTRSAEECFNLPPTGIIGQTELTIFYQGIVERLGGSDGHALALSQSADASGSSRILLYRNSGNGNMYVYVQDSTTQFSTPLLANSNPQINDKYAIAIKDNDLVIYCNGVKVSENTVGSLPSTQYIYLNKWNNLINQQNIIKDFKIYNTRLSNEELQQLTKI